MNPRGFVPLAEAAPVMKGYIPAVTTTGGANPKIDQVGFIHHSKAMRKTNRAIGRNFWDEKQFAPTPVPQTVVDKLHAGLPQVVRRDPKERYRTMLQRISEDVLTMYRATGRIHWPRSAWDELKVIAWKTGDPNLLQFGGEDQLRRQIEALTRHVVETGEMKQKAKDHRKVVRDWHGH